MNREPKILELSVTFNGNDCIFEGPDEFKAGPVTLTFYNENDTVSVLNFVKFDEGRTTQDLIDYFNDPDSGHTPSRADDNTYYTYDRLLAGKSKVFDFELEPGSYAFICVQSSPIEITVIDGFTVR
jgi:hypothetical protein